MIQPASAVTAFAAINDDSFLYVEEERVARLRTAAWQLVQNVLPADTSALVFADEFASFDGAVGEESASVHRGAVTTNRGRTTRAV